MFITVKYGEKEEALFNPYCKTMLLLEDIKKRCKCSTDVQVDLSDQEGNVKHLTDAPLRYANELLKERESFVLIRVEKGEDENQKPQYTPLLNDDQAIDAAFLARLSTKDNLGLHSAKTNMRKKGRSSDRGRDSQRGRTGAKSTTPTGRRKSEKR